MADSLGERSEIGEDSELSYLYLCKGELIYVDESHYLQLWNKIFVPCAVRMRADRESNPGHLRDKQGY